MGSDMKPKPVLYTQDLPLRQPLKSVYRDGALWGFSPRAHLKTGAITSVVLLSLFGGAAYMKFAKTGPAAAAVTSKAPVAQYAFPRAFRR